MNPKFKLYRHYDAFGNLLYVGISTNITSRLANHRSYATWFDRITLIRIENYTNIKEIREIEKKIINEEKPEFNVVYNIKNKKRKRTDIISLYELADYLKVVRGRLRMDFQLNRCPFVPVQTNPFRFIKGDIMKSLENPQIKEYVRKLRK